MSYIVNFSNLATNNLRRKALFIAEAGYEALDIKRVVSGRIKLRGNTLEIQYQHKKLRLNLGSFNRIFLIGIGKGSALASATLAKILGQRLTHGIALDIVELKTKNLKLETLVGAHPLPLIQNIKQPER